MVSKIDTEIIGKLQYELNQKFALKMQIPLIQRILQVAIDVSWLEQLLASSQIIKKQKAQLMSLE